MRRSPVLAGLAGIALLAGLACGSSDDGASSSSTESDGQTLVVYSGRSEELVGPLIEMFEEETDIDVEVRYGGSPELAAQILEEGDNSPADVFFSQDAGALGAVSLAGGLTELDAEYLDAVPEAFRSQKGEWVGTSGRVRVVAYNTEALTFDEVPDTILAFTDPQWKGRIGWAPTNASFQAFVTALRLLEGEDGARAWLEGIKANEPLAYDNNLAVLDAIARGEIDVGFVNHYYLYRVLAEDPEAPVANKFFPNGDPGALVNVAGAGILTSADHPDAAERFVAFLLSDRAQQFFADDTYEIPLVDGISPSAELPDLAELTQPEIDLDQLEDLEGTLALLQETGVL